MDAARAQRFAELCQMFTVTERSGPLCPYELAMETLALHLNRQHGRQVVVRRTRPATN